MCHLIKEKELHRNVSANNTYSEVTEPSAGLEPPPLNSVIHNPPEETPLDPWCGSTHQAGRGFEQPDRAKGFPVCP